MWTDFPNCRTGATFRLGASGGHAWISCDRPRARQAGEWLLGNAHARTGAGFGSPRTQCALTTALATQMRSACRRLYQTRGLVSVVKGNAQILEKLREVRVPSGIVWPILSPVLCLPRAASFGMSGSRALSQFGVMGAVAAIAVIAAFIC
jgi:hypothetical protein